MIAEFGFNVCRVCTTPKALLPKNVELTPIFDNDGEIADQLKQISGLDLSNEKLKSLICSQCSKGLKKSAIFMRKLMKADSIYFAPRRLIVKENPEKTFTNPEEIVILSTSKDPPTSQITSENDHEFKRPSLLKRKAKNLKKSVDKRVSFGGASIKKFKADIAQNASESLLAPEKSALNLKVTEELIEDDLEVIGNDLTLMEQPTANNIEASEPSKAQGESILTTIIPQNVFNVGAQNSSNTSGSFQSSSSLTITQNATNWQMQRMLMEDADASEFRTFREQNKTKPEEEYLFLALNASSSSAVNNMTQSMRIQSDELIENIKVSTVKGEDGVMQVVFNCHFCEKSYLTMKECGDHVEMYHVANKNHSCKFCPRSFSLGKDLTDHERKHEMRRSRASELIQRKSQGDMIEVQDDDNTEVRKKNTEGKRKRRKKQKSYTCICGKNFKFNISLQKHQKRCKYSDPTVINPNTDKDFIEIQD